MGQIREIRVAQEKSFAARYYEIEGKSAREQGALLIVWRDDAIAHDRSIMAEWKEAGISKQTASRKIRYAKEGLSSETYIEFLRRTEPSKKPRKRKEKWSVDAAIDRLDAAITKEVESATPGERVLIGGFLRQQGFFLEGGKKK